MKTKSKSRGAGGRPCTITTEVVAKLEYAFLAGCTDTEACFYAGISRDALYRYQTANPEFRNRKEKLKENPVLKARLKVLESIENGDMSTAKWLLERKKRDEFGNQIDLNINELHHLDDYQLEQLEQEIMDKIAANAGYIRIEDNSDIIDVTPQEIDDNTTD